MKILRRKCVRCEEAIQPTQVDQIKMIYACPYCHSVSSVYEERDFIAEEKIVTQSAGISYEYLASDLHIYMDQLPTGEMQRSVIGTGIILLVFIGIFALTGSVILLWLFSVLGGIGWVINLVLYWRIEVRTYEVELNHHRVQFFEKLCGMKRLLKEIGSYEIDRIQIVTKENSGAPGKNKTDFIIQTKQYNQLKPFFHSNNKEAQLAYLKFLMDSYLNIRERASDISG